MVGLYVPNQDDAYNFYVDKLGFTVQTDARNGDYRRLTVQHPDQPTFRLGLFRPQALLQDATTAQALNELVAKGAMPPLVFAVGDNRATYERLRAKVVEFTQEPVARYGNVDANFRDPSGMVGYDLGGCMSEQTGDWRGEMLARVRKVIHAADPDAVEEAKWVKPSNPAGVPTWSHDGIICTGETYKTHVKLTFAKGASLPDPAGLFNASLDGGTRRAIDIREGETIDEAALKSLVRSAVALNQATMKQPKKAS